MSTGRRTHSAAPNGFETLPLAAALADTLTDGILLTDVESRIRHANPAAIELLGWQAGARGSELDTDAIPLDPETLHRLRTATGGWSADASLSIRGETISLHILFEPIAHDGRRVGSVIVLSERGDVRAALKDRDQARENDRAKTRSLHLVAHDLSGPLTVLKGYVALLEGGDLDLEQFSGYIPILSAQIAQIGRLVQAILDTARLEEGRLELLFADLDLVDFVRQLVAGVALVERRHHFIVSPTLAQLPVRADPIRLDSILRNVIMNAVKYSAEGTRITCALTSDHDTARVHIADEGAGIAPADVEFLFTRFGRVGNLMTNPAGVGIGLFLSRQLARLHGGELSGESEEGRGSVFTLSLPLRRES